MNTKLILLMILAMAAWPASAINRSHTSSLTQVTSKQSWTQKCTMKATGISSLQSYWGNLWIQYNDPNGEEILLQRTYTVGPGATTFTESSAGLYSISVTLNAKNIVVTFSATRYGPMYQRVNPDSGIVEEGGSFNCRGAIIVGTGYAGDPNFWTIIHSINNLERVGQWQ